MITVRLNHLRIAPRKVRLVTDLIRGLSASVAESQLRFMTKKAAGPVAKLLKAAIAGAAHDYQLQKEDLFVAKIQVGGGPILKRWMPRAMGRAAAIRKRTSHIVLSLDSNKPEVFAAKKEEKPAGKKERSNKREALVSKEIIQEQEEKKSGVPAPQKPYRADTQSKKKFFSRQTANRTKKFLRRKSI